MQAEEIGRNLEAAMECLRTRQADPVVGMRGVGVPDADALLIKLSADLQGEFPPGGPVFDGPDVVLATQIYKDGGHTGLIGDMVTALNAMGLAGEAAPARLIVTNLHGHHPKNPAAAHLARLGPAAKQLTVLRGTGRSDKLVELLRLLRIWRPGRIFLCHHPDDPIPVVAGSTDWSGQTVFIHHADATPSLGMHLAGAKLVDLSPAAAALSRALGHAPALLPLTVPDPGPHPQTFMVRGALTTATCARGHKLVGDGPHAYADAVGIILAISGGWHIHIGSIGEDLLAAILRGLRAHGVAEDRFIYLPLVPSLARALHEHAVDVYISSFPVDGARTNVEVAAAGVAHLRHRTKGKTGPEGGFPLAGSLAWGDWDDLRARLVALSDPILLRENSHLMRATYEHVHHPSIFASTLRTILAGGQGWLDPQADARDAKAKSALQGT